MKKFGNGIMKVGNKKNTSMKSTLSKKLCIFLEQTARAVKGKKDFLVLIWYSL